MIAKHTGSRPRAAAAAWITAALSYVILEAVAAAAFRPHYSYARNFISDLGIPSHSPLAWLMNVAFCLQGTLFLAGAVALSKARLFLAFAAANTIGNVVIAAFHSGPSPTAGAHVIGAVLAIVGGNAAVLAGSSIIGGWHRNVSVALGAFGLVSFVTFVIELPSAVLPLGVLERCSVYSITAWQLLTGAWLLSRRPTL
jgi:hypothetical membrane protein